VLLFALAATDVRPHGIFNNTEFLMLTLISMTQGHRCDLDQRKNLAANDRGRGQRLAKVPDSA
jgi:hypothetical protein